MRDPVHREKKEARLQVIVELIAQSSSIMVRAKGYNTGRGGLWEDEIP